MRTREIELPQFLDLRTRVRVLDSRSEGEFQQGHIPGAINLPILNNEERKVVGTIYKQQGSQEAILKGFELVGPRFHDIIRRALDIFPERKIITYCRRGGMRSETISWLLGLAGFEIWRLKGGYKNYRKYALETIGAKRNFIVLGGRTGVGKTILLRELQKIGEPVIDLEAIASHKGSTFGGINMPPQPSVEHFENILAEEFYDIAPGEYIWIENESRRIGKVNLAEKFYANILDSPLVEITRPMPERIKQIAEEYGNLPERDLLDGVERLKKKLGGARTQEVSEAIRSKQHSAWIADLLTYYDKAYDFELTKNKRTQAFAIDLENRSFSDAAQALLAIKNTLIQ